MDYTIDFDNCKKFLMLVLVACMRTIFVRALYLRVTLLLVRVLSVYSSMATSIWQEAVQ